MDFCDSDEELIPSVSSFNAMFSRVQQQARQAPVSSSQSPSSNPSSSSKKSSKGKLAKKSSTKSSSEKSLKKAKKSKDTEPPQLSEETKNLLAEMDSLTTTRHIRSEPLPTPTQSTSTRSTRSKKSSNIMTTSTTSRGRRGRKVIQKVSDDDDVQCLEPTFDNSINEDIVVAEPVHELSSLRILWKSELLRFRVPSETKMSKIRMDLAEKVSTRADNLIILDGETNEEISDNVAVSTIPFGRTLEAFEREKTTVDDNSNLTAKNIDPNSVLIKLQGCGGYRERYTVVIKRVTHVKQLIEDYTTKFNLHGKRFKLVFDGEDLEETETPESLDLDNGDMIDVVEM